MHALVALQMLTCVWHRYVERRSAENTSDSSEEVTLLKDKDARSEEEDEGDEYNAAAQSASDSSSEVAEGDAEAGTPLFSLFRALLIGSHCRLCRRLTSSSQTAPRPRRHSASPRPSPSSRRVTTLQSRLTC